jgi:hypothetical protein
VELAVLPFNVPEMGCVREVIREHGYAQRG